MCSDSIFNLLNSYRWQFLFLCKTLVFLFLPFLNLGTQIRCPQNWYTNLKSALDQPLLNKQSFPNGQFKIPGYVLLCCLVDCYKFGGGIMVFVREDIPSSVLSLNKSIESLFIELNFHKKKWLFAVHIILTYNISNHLDLLRRSLDSYSAEYEHFIIVEDFLQKLLRQV